MTVVDDAQTGTPEETLAQLPPISITLRIERNRSVSAQATPASERLTHAAVVSACVPVGAERRSIR